MRRNEDRRNNFGTASGIGAMLVVMLGGVVRQADDVGRVMLRSADDFRRAGFHQMDDIGRSGFGLHQVDDLGGSFRHASDDVLRFTDDAGHRWAEFEAVENIGQFGAERKVEVIFRSCSREQYPCGDSPARTIRRQQCVTECRGVHAFGAGVWVRIPPALLITMTLELKGRAF